MLTELFITADAGGSKQLSGARVEVRAAAPRPTSSACRSTSAISRPGPGKQVKNKVEHCLFSFITMNWRGKPLRTHETVVNLIGNTTNSGWPRGERHDRPSSVPDREENYAETVMSELKIELHRDTFHFWRLELHDSPEADRAVTNHVIHSRALSSGALSVGQHRLRVHRQ